MVLVVYWYDLICFGIVGVAVVGSLYVLWRREAGGKCDDKSMYESLLVGQLDRDAYGGVSSSQLWSSCWRGLHPIWLLGLRFVSCVVMAGFLAWDILEYDASIFVYYTEWTFTTVTAYFAIGTIVSAHGCMVYYSKKPPPDNREKEDFLKTDVEESISTNAVTFRAKEFKGTIKLQSHYDQEAIGHIAGFWGYLMQTAYQTCAGAVILTDIVFWCIIVPFLSNAHLKVNLLMGCMHTLNAVFLLLDTSVNSLPFPWFRLAYFVLCSCSYVIFQWVIHACGFSWWPYPFLELSTPWAPFWYFCLAVVHIPCYGLYSLLVKAKNSIFSRLFPHAFVRSY
ncbi:hypothetical protein F0562_021503 [Nyssa sinensis]|uniref:Uncharacterized protein n=1 Tax=Nyssa sinensis TaxID=561372 RepID=A0A5J5BMP4_9ASTE|nr:hypothetical protein F0562_021503 [Nyssa sinensis]